MGEQWLLLFTADLSAQCLLKTYQKTCKNNTKIFPNDSILYNHSTMIRKPDRTFLTNVQIHCKRLLINTINTNFFVPLKVHLVQAI